VSLLIRDVEIQDKRAECRGVKQTTNDAEEQ